MVNTKIMARSGGFEPPTAWFVARYSIQLSYERAVFCILKSVPSLGSAPQGCNINGALGRIRTSDRLVRSQVLYPAELRARSILYTQECPLLGSVTSVNKQHRLMYGASGRIRTSDRLVRSQVLYPAELRTRRGMCNNQFSTLKYQFIVTNNGALGRIRTSDRLVRSQVLYPAELRARKVVFTKTRKNGGEGGIRTLDTAINRILP